MNVDQVRHLGEIRSRTEAATEGPWRTYRQLDCPREASDDEAMASAVWGIAAGKETWHNNKGWFHRLDAKYRIDEKLVVEVASDRDYCIPEGGIARAADAAFVAHAREDVPWLLALVDDLVAENTRLRLIMPCDEKVGCQAHSWMATVEVLVDQRDAERVLVDRLAVTIRTIHDQRHCRRVPCEACDGSVTGQALAAYDAARGERNPE